MSTRGPFCRPGVPDPLCRIHTRCPRRAGPFRVSAGTPGATVGRESSPTHDGWWVRMTSNDLVVVLPGITGSTLGVRGDDGSPASENLIWAPSGGAVWKLLTGGQSILKKALPEGIGDGHPDDGVEPVALMPDVHVLPGIWTPIRGYDVLVSALETLGYQPGGGGRPAIAHPVRLRLAPVEPLQRGAAGDRRGARAGAAAGAGRGVCRRQGRLHRPLHGWPGRAVVHREVRWRRGHPQAHHARHAVARCDRRARAARQRRQEGDRAAVGRPDGLLPEHALALPAAPGVSRASATRAGGPRRRRCRCPTSARRWSPTRWPSTPTSRPPRPRVRRATP